MTDVVNSGQENAEFLKALKQRKIHAQALAEGYTPAKRRMEIACMVIGTALWLWNTVFLTRSVIASSEPVLPLVVGALIFGIFLADFLSGLTHWWFDTWGSVDTPIIGKSFVRSFREHHVKPYAICDHDMVQTNGDNFLTIIPHMAAFALLGDRVPLPVLAGHLTAALFVALTNQIHKWSHEKPADVPPFVRLLQNYSIILPRSHHNVHHDSPFDCYYCITTGWCNYPLEIIGFWKKFEWFVVRVCGAKPREDDHKWSCVTAAQAARTSDKKSKAPQSPRSSSSHRKSP